MENITESLHNTDTPITDDQPRDLILSSIMNKLWDTKNGRPVIYEEPTSGMAICLTEPTYKTDFIVTKMIDFLIDESKTNTPYSWSKSWGQTRVALSPDGSDSWHFYNTQDHTSKKYQPIFTTNKYLPSESMNSDRKWDDLAYTIIINDDVPLTMESSVLQIERMIDELIWVTAYNKLDTTENLPSDIYLSVLNDVKNRGVNVGYATSGRILNHRLKNPNDSVRIYGDIHRQQTIPRVIGVVIAPGKKFDGFCKKLKKSTTRVRSPSEDYISAPDQTVGNTTALIGSITIGKHPHIGHLLLITRLFSLAKSSGSHSKIFLELNDTGVRFDGMLEAATKDTSKNLSQVIDGINSGEYSLSDIEKWYKARLQKKEDVLYRIPREVPVLSMRTQMEEITNTLTDLFPHGIIDYVLSSDLKHDDVLAKSDLPWKDTGYEVISAKPLRKRSGVTSLLTRLSFVNLIAAQDGVSKLLYVDSSPEINDAVRISNAEFGTDIVCKPGAGIGLDFTIYSGTTGDDRMYVSSLKEKYRNERIPINELLRDSEYLSTVLPVVVPPSKIDSYYNFMNQESVMKAYIRARNERLELSKKLFDIERLIPVSNVTTYADKISKKHRKELDALLRVGLDKATNLMEGEVVDLRVYDFAIDETVEMEKLAQKYTKTNGKCTNYSQRDKCDSFLSALSYEIDAGREPNSKIIGLLRYMGYDSVESLKHAIDGMVSQRLILRYRLTGVQLVLKNVELIMTSVTSISEKQSTSLYNTAHLLGLTVL